MQKLILNSEEIRKRALTIIQNMPLDPVQEIIIKSHKKDRSAEQNRYYWQVLTIIGNELGEVKEELHQRYKDKFLVNIYTRDNPEYAEMIESLKEVWRQGLKNQALQLRKKIVELTSTTTATVKQMAEYLESIEKDVNSMGIYLPAMED